MSRLSVLAALALTLPFVSGCFGGTPGLPSAVLPIVDLGAVLAPGAVLEKVEGGIRVVWTGPLETDQAFMVTFPEGVTRIDATFTKADPKSLNLALFNAKTGRIRCQPDEVAAWFTSSVGQHRCAGTTVLDPYPSTWRTSKNFNAPATVGGASLKAGESLELLLANVPLDGQAGMIKAAALSQPRFAEAPTTIFQVPATVDDAKLHVEVTRPETNEKVPTIIVSSPYNQATRLAKLRPENSTIADWVPRGYAVVSADVRGFALSGGCIEVWGPKEQQDQVDLVEWVAAQPWSNGKIGFYGQSYVGTTPVEAASHAPPHLTTIITIAPVINAYEDWHFGGVPNGENSGSPLFYSYQDTGQYLSMATANNDPQTLGQAIAQSQHGFCDPTMTARANDPRAVYDSFYRERDFKTMAKNVKASVFYTQGFYDTNVKSQMIPDWFEALNVPKKGLFGDWLHQHPPRADQELLFHAWFDHWLMGRDTGIMETPSVEVRTNVDTVRTATTWPPRDATARSLGLDLDGKALLLDAAGKGFQGFLAHPDPQGTPQTVVEPGTSLVLESAPATERLYVSGIPELRFRASLAGAPNAHLYSSIEDVDADGKARILSFGMLNLAHNRDHTTWTPVVPNEPRDYALPFLATEYVIEPGHRLVLTLRAASLRDWAGMPNPAGASASPGFIIGLAGDVLAGSSSPPAQVTVTGGSSALLLPTLPMPGDVPAPRGAGPAPFARLV